MDFNLAVMETKALRSLGVARCRQNITPQGQPAVICPCSPSEDIFVRRLVKSISGNRPQVPCPPERVSCWQAGAVNFAKIIAITQSILEQGIHKN